MSTVESKDVSMAEGLLEYGGKEWCARMAAQWAEVVYPNIADAESYNYSAQFTDTDTGAVFQWRAEKGRIVYWEPGKVLSDDECTFILSATHDNWRKVADGKLDGVGAVAAKRVHLHKGPMPVVIREATAFKILIGPQGHGSIPTAW
jgi:putative sterol carrier protein